MINLLSEETIDQIAAGEVVERPASAVKEMCENAIDAGATMISVEIKEGGISFIRVTDNGIGIDKSDIKKAFLRHATSKITCIDDLLSLESLGFRGEALSSIAAVSQMEVISKQKDSLVGTRFVINGSVPGDTSEIGAPDGTTFIVRNLFYNTPVRRKFLKSASTEGSYITDVMEHLALSHPEIAFSYINGGKTQLQTSGRGDLKEVIYRIYGKEVTSNLIEINSPGVSGFVAKPIMVRNNRSFETFFVNGRFVKSSILSNALEEAYKPYLMQHKFPFAILHLNLAGSDVDANVHPTKMEVRFSDNNAVYNNLCDAVKDALNAREMIFEAKLNDIHSVQDEKEVKDTPEAEDDQVVKKVQGEQTYSVPKPERERPALPFEKTRVLMETAKYDAHIEADEELSQIMKPKQLDLFEERILTKEARDEYRILGQAFLTYWIVEYRDKLLIMDQHAAHEKVLYERFRKNIRENEIISQQIMPPRIISFDSRQEDVFKRFESYFVSVGFEIEEFGGGEYAVRALPELFKGVDFGDVLTEILDNLLEEEAKLTRNVDQISEQVNDRIATMACKAAVKGNNKMSIAEVEALLDELLTLDNPYNCPHGRPTMITMTKYELEKKFKRII